MTAISRKVFRSYHRYRINRLRPDNCRYRLVQKELRRLVTAGNGSLTLERTATSIEGRSIPLLRYGSGPVRVLLWSQMHGDEPTATLALMDIFKFLVSDGIRDLRMEAIGRRCSLYFIPMLNPDGAEEVERHTAGRVDMNRDARRLATPEACFLRDTQREIRPAYAFNLHDQALSTVGEGPGLAAIALLAPAPDGSGKVTAARRGAIHVAAAFARSVSPFARGLIATYDDVHEPRAFGDAMQRWGTSTLLVESGHYRRDPQKEYVRKLNFVGLLSVLHAIADGSYRKAPVALYNQLPTNGKRGYDLIIRNVTLVQGRRWRGRVSVGFEGKRERTMTAYYVREIGDLGGFGAVIELTARGARIPRSELWIDRRLTAGKIRDIFRVEMKKGQE